MENALTASAFHTLTDDFNRARAHTHTHANLNTNTIFNMVCAHTDMMARGNSGIREIRVMTFDATNNTF